jgi:hypothetical protein
LDAYREIAVIRRVRWPTHFALASSRQVLDTYRILVKIGRIPVVGALFQKMLEVPEAPDGILVEELGTPFDAARTGRRSTREESRAVGGVSTTSNIG